MSHDNFAADEPQSTGSPNDTGHPDSAEWCLVGKIDQATAQCTTRINTTPFRIGRCAELSLTIPNPTVSGVHAEIDAKDGWLIVRDLASTNGTFVNGSRVYGEAALFENDVVQFADVALRLQREVSGSAACRTAVSDASDRAAALINFDQLIDGEAAVAFYQPIVCFSTQQTVAYEVLARSRLFGLKTPKEMFAVAAQLELQGELSRCFRQKGIAVGEIIHKDTNLFVNTHPIELGEPGLIPSLAELRTAAGDRPLTLEIHESAVTDVGEIRELHATLTSLDIQLAYDDFGAGQARLLELADVPPDYLKFDLQLVQGIHGAAAHRQQMLATLVRMVTDLGVTPIAEGIETEDDSVACKELGFALAQGYFFGRPGPARTFIDKP